MVSKNDVSTKKVLYCEVNITDPGFKTDIAKVLLQCNVAGEIQSRDTKTVITITGGENQCMNASRKIQDFCRGYAVDTSLKFVFVDEEVSFSHVRICQSCEYCSSYILRSSSL